MRCPVSTYRTAPLPRHWAALRKAVLHTHRGVCHVCGLPGATEVDHITPASRGGTDHPSNLAPIHGRRDVIEGRAKTNCHGAKTAREAGATARKREPERHPGAIR
ncbi:MAG: HNH endonuclease [Dehalococcoidia bacterium]